MKNAEKHIGQPIVGHCLVMPKGGAKGVMRGAVTEELGSAWRATSDMAAARPNSSSPLEPGATSVGMLVAPLRLAWADGSAWEVEVPRGEAKRARALVEQLQG